MFRDKFQEILMKTKLKALAKQHKKASTMRSQDGDASLQIEGREVKSFDFRIDRATHRRNAGTFARPSNGLDRTPPRRQQTKRQRVFSPLTLEVADNVAWLVGTPGFQSNRTTQRKYAH